MIDIYKILYKLGLSDEKLSNEIVSSDEYLLNLPEYDYEETKVEIDNVNQRVIKYNPSFYDGVRECVMYKSLHHPNIITCREIDFFDYLSFGHSKEKINIMRMVKITFDKYIPCDDPQFSSTLVNNNVMLMKMLVEMVSAIHYLSVSKILHSDIKPGNIFYDDKKDRFLLADFDLVTIGEESYNLRAFTPWTAAPELGTDVYNVDDPRGDVFSLAVTLTSLLMGKAWYPQVRMKNDLIQKNVNIKEYRKILSSVHEELIKNNFPETDLVMQMLEYDYKKRPYIEELYESLVTKKEVTKPLSLIKGPNSRIIKLIYQDYMMNIPSAFQKEKPSLYPKLALDSSFFASLIYVVIKINLDNLTEEERVYTFALIETSAFMMVNALTSPKENYAYKKKIPELIDFGSNTFKEGTAVRELYPSYFKNETLSENELEDLYTQNSSYHHEFLLQEILKMYDFVILV